MSSSIVTLLPLDLTGNAPENHRGAEHHPLVAIPGITQRIVTMTYGGFYTKDLQVFDENYRKLRAGKDFIYSYVHAKLKARVGLNICSAIVILNPDLQNEVIVSGQMVGGDLAYSFSVVEDYTNFIKSKPADYVCLNDDYVGEEPIWQTGELEERMWGLDKYQPFNNELENIKRAITDGSDSAETEFRNNVKERYEQLMARFDDRLVKHIADRDDPHEVNKRQVGLGQLNNFPVADQVTADEGISNEHYITPKLANSAVQTLAIEPFNKHVNVPPTNPHKDSYLTIGSHSKEQLDALLDSVYDVKETVANTDAIRMEVPGVFTPGDYDVNTVIANARMKVDTSCFDKGTIPVNRFSWGTPTAKHVLRGDGVWVPIETITLEFGNPIPAPRALHIGNAGSRASAIAALRASFGNVLVWPVGSVAFYTVNAGNWFGTGNGMMYITVPNNYAAVRRDTGWVNI